MRSRSSQDSELEDVGIYTYIWDFYDIQKVVLLVRLKRMESGHWKTFFSDFVFFSNLALITIFFCFHYQSSLHRCIIHSLVPLQT